MFVLNRLFSSSFHFDPRCLLSFFFFNSCVFFQAVQISLKVCFSFGSGMSSRRGQGGPVEIAWRLPQDSAYNAADGGRKFSLNNNSTFQRVCYTLVW